MSVYFWLDKQKLETEQRQKHFKLNQLQSELDTNSIYLICKLCPNLT